MDDLLERLGRPVDPDDPNLWEIDRDRIDAAAAIKRLQAELQTLQIQMVNLAGMIHRGKEP